MQYDVGVVNDTQECTTSRHNNYRVRRGNDVDGDEDFADERSNEAVINFPSESVFLVVQRRYHPRRLFCLLPCSVVGVQYMIWRMFISLKSFVKGPLLVLRFTAVELSKKLKGVLLV